MVVAADNVVGEAIRGGGDVDIVGGIGLDDRVRRLPLDKDGDGAERIHPEIQLFLRRTEILPDPGITEASSQLVESGGRGDQLESTVTQETNEDLARGSLGPDQGADKNVRVEDGAHRGLRRALPLAGPVLRLVGETIRPALSRGTPSKLERFEKACSGGPLELEELLDRNHRRERLALPLDDEVIVPQGNAIQIIAETLPDFHCRDLLRHGTEVYQLLEL